MGACSVWAEFFRTSRYKKDSFKKAKIKKIKSRRPCVCAPTEQKTDLDNVLRHERRPHVHQRHDKVHVMQVSLPAPAREVIRHSVLDQLLRTFRPVGVHRRRSRWPVRRVSAQCAFARAVTALSRARRGGRRDGRLRHGLLGEEKALEQAGTCVRAVGLVPGLLLRRFNTLFDGLEIDANFQRWTKVSQMHAHMEPMIPGQKNPYLLINTGDGDGDSFSLT